MKGSRVRVPFPALKVEKAAEEGSDAAFCDCVKMLSLCCIENMLAEEWIRNRDARFLQKGINAKPLS